MTFEGFKDRNTRDWKSREAQESELSKRINRLFLLVIMRFPPAKKEWW
jgi:hypothetical protein